MVAFTVFCYSYCNPGILTMCAEMWVVDEENWEGEEGRMKAQNTK